MWQRWVSRSWLIMKSRSGRGEIVGDRMQFMRKDTAPISSSAAQLADPAYQKRKADREAEEAERERVRRAEAKRAKLYAQETALRMREWADVRPKPDPLNPEIGLWREIDGGDVIVIVELVGASPTEILIRGSDHPITIQNSQIKRPRHYQLTPVHALWMRGDLARAKRLSDVNLKRSTLGCE